MGRDWSAVFDLDCPADDLLEHFETATFEGRRYRHLPDARHGVERETAIIDGTIVRGYPSIPRTLVLDPGIPEHFDGPVVVEEKLNGYNVRIVHVPPTGDGTGETTDSEGESTVHSEDVLAVTRGGFVCPYTSRNVIELVDLTTFFEDNPAAMLCAEVIGPANPYTEHDYAGIDDAALRVFDIRDRESGEPVPVEGRRERCDQYDLPQVPAFGVHDPRSAVRAVREAIADLDERGREGVVLTSTDGHRQLKYTTSAIHRSDLAHAFARPFDYGRQFMFSRIVREAFQAVEFEEDEAAVGERARDLGEAILRPAIEAVRAVEADEPVGERHTVRGDPAAIASLLAHFRNQGLELVIERDKRTGGERVVEFTKVATTTRDKTKHYLDGGLIDE